VRRARVAFALVLAAPGCATPLLLAGCFSLEAPQRRERLEALLAEPVVPVVIDPRVHLAFVRVEEALTFSSGFEGGERLRAQFELPSPVPGFAEAFVAALREQPRFAPTPFVSSALEGAREALAARGDAPVFFASAGSWRLYYDLSLRRYRMSAWLHVQVTPAAEVAAGRGAMALPDRLWSGDCTFRGPEAAQPIEAWLAEDGALLHRTLAEAQQRCGRAVAERLLGFIERGEEQGAFDEGDLAPEEPR
jgi:hypothetical protein